MKKFYFTFGTDTQFPYGINEFVVAEALNKNMAMRMLMTLYGNRRKSRQSDVYGAFRLFSRQAP